MLEQYLTLNTMTSGSYMQRTRHNATTSDFTVACALEFATAGERNTKKMAGDKYLALALDRPAIECARELYRQLVKHKAKVLNLAGNGMHVLHSRGVTQRQVNVWVHDMLVLIHLHYPLQLLKSGGQTGVDIAAAVVGPYLHIPTEINFPFGYMQRREDGVDIMQSQDDVLQSIAQMRADLIQDLKTDS